jgi:hypothetical protein
MWQFNSAMDNDPFDFDPQAPILKTTVAGQSIALFCDADLKLQNQPPFYVTINSVPLEGSDAACWEQAKEAYDQACFERSEAAQDAPEHPHEHQRYRRQEQRAHALVRQIRHYAQNDAVFPHLCRDANAACASIGSSLALVGAKQSAQEQRLLTQAHRLQAQVQGVLCAL